MKEVQNAAICSTDPGRLKKVTYYEHISGKGRRDLL
jgi:hypothetical protein